MGHYFHLMHTHQFWNIPCLREPVSRTMLDFSCFPFLRTCSVNGDFLCDTPADPNLSRDIDFSDLDADGDQDLVDANANCRYIGTDLGLRDEFAFPFTPDVTNYMAYSNGACRSTFTQQQRLVMTYNLQKRVLSPLKWHWKADSAEGVIDAYEPDNHVTTASPIAVGDWQQHTLHDFGCEQDSVDWIAVNGDFFGTYTLNILEVQNEVFPIDPDVEVFNANENGIIEDQIPVAVNSVGNSVAVTIPCGSVNSNQPRIAIKRNANADAGAYLLSLSNSVPQPALSGDALLDQVCINTLLELENVPEGAEVNWTTMGMTITNINNHSALVDDVLPGSAPANLIVEIISGACSLRLEKEFQRSIPLPEIESINKSIHTGPCPEKIFTYSIHPVPGATSYRWECDDCPLVATSDGLSARLYSNDLAPGSTTSFTVKVTATSDCQEMVDQDRNDIMTTLHPHDCEIPLIIIVPNPGDQHISLEIEHQVETPNYEIYITRQIDAALVHQQTITQKTLSIDTKDYANGYYYLHLIYEGQQQAALFLIQH